MHSLLLASATLAGNGTLPLPQRRFNMSENISLVATYANHGLAKSTARKFQTAGFNMKKLYLVSNDRNDMGELEGAAVLDRLDGLDEAQYACIPRDRVLDYEAELKADRLLLVAHGTADTIAQAKSIIDETHPDDWNGNVSCTVYYGCVD
jgi:hypothetical protein